MTATGTDAKSDEVRSATLLHFERPEALDIYNTFTWTGEGDQRKLIKSWKNVKNIAPLVKSLPGKDTSLTPELSNVVKH